MFDAKLVGDFITAARGWLGFIMIWLGLTQGAEALPIVVMLLLLDWTGDFVDGSIARLSHNLRRTWIGDADIYVDLLVSISLGVYLICAGYVGLPLGVWYILGWILICWSFGLDKNLLMLMQAPIYLWFMLTALRVIPDSGLWLLLWVFTAILVNWRHLSGQIVPNFINGMVSIWRDRHTQ